MHLLNGSAQFVRLHHHYAYDVAFDGDLVVQDSRDPEHDLARALLARGLTGKVTMLDGITGKPRTIINIENAAERCIGSNRDMYRWKPSESGNSRRPAAEDDIVLPTHPTRRGARVVEGG